MQLKRITRVWIFVGLVIIVVVVGATMRIIGRRRSPGPDIRNVLLISIDTCRRDRLSCYGFDRPTTPNVDALAEDGVLFTHAVTPVPLTLPAHSSMLTGTNPPFHGVRDNEDYQLAALNVTLAETLKDQGLATGAVIGAFVLDSQFGLDQGFDWYQDRFDQSLNLFGVAQRRGDEVTHQALQWMGEHRQEPFFLFVHYFDPHVDYDPPEPFNSRLNDNPYAGEIAYTDWCLGRLVRALKDLDLYDSTLIIVTSDHGEMLGEHGEKTHSYFIYEGVVKVPLVIRCPGARRGKRIEDPVGLIDVVPTICGLLRIDTPPNVEGIDLGGYLGFKQPIPGPRHLYCESLTPTKYGANPLRGVVTDGWKYILTTRPELYDLRKDPREQHNLAGVEQSVARKLKAQLKEIVSGGRRGLPGSSRPLSQGDLRRLESLGYVGGGGTTDDEDLEPDPDKHDPKDRFEFYTTYNDVNPLIELKRFEEAEAMLRKLLQQQPDFARGHVRLGRIALLQQKFPAAISSLRRALELDPSRAAAHNNLGIAYGALGRFDQAIHHFREALRIQPFDSMSRNNLKATLKLKRQRP